MTEVTFGTGATEVTVTNLTYNILEKFQTGVYIEPIISTSSAVGTILVADRLYAVPFVVARAMTFDRIAIEVTTAAAGKLIRLGIYNDGTNLYPGTLVLDAGTVSTTATGIKAITINQALTNGLYWLVLVSDGTPQIAWSYWGWTPLGKNATDFTAVKYRHWLVTFTYAALPDPFTAGGAATTATSATHPGIFLRLLTLD